MQERFWGRIYTENEYRCKNNNKNHTKQPFSIYRYSQNDQISKEKSEKVLTTEHDTAYNIEKTTSVVK